MSVSKLKKTFHIDILNSEMNNNNINFNYYDTNTFNELVTNEISNKNFSIFHSNISSLNGNFEKLELLLNRLAIKFDIISLTETWNPEKKTIDSNHLIGYQKYVSQPGTTMKSGSGFYISDNINFIPRKDLDKHFYNQCNEFSCKWIEVINKNKPNSVIASIYRHPSKNDKEFLCYLKSTFKTLKKENKFIFITGDFNLNLLNYEKNNEVKEFLDILYSNFYQPYIIHPTRIVDNAKPSLIDNIFANTIEHNPISGTT